MCDKQMDLVKRIEFQRRVLEANPQDVVESVELDSLISELRDTFYVIENLTYTKSEPKARLQLIS